MTAAPSETNVSIPTVDGDLEGILASPPDPAALVVFAHGSGSSRFSRRNRQVAAFLNRCGLATLLFDLLTPQEESVDEITREFRFDIDLLADRLCLAVDWIHQRPELARTPVALFGSSTGAAAALVAASRMPETIRSVVSRGGRPDLAGEALRRVKASTLLLVGELDRAVLDLNREAARLLPRPPRLEIVPGATHLFEEPGKLEIVARLAADWVLETTAPPPLLEPCTAQIQPPHGSRP